MKCKHRWMLAVDPQSAYVYCINCAKRFKPKAQQFTYHGEVPKDLQE
jgi:hypothetical protein